MGGRRQNGVVASLLISIFLFSLLSPLVGPVEESELNVEFTSPSIGQTSTVSIGSYPDGVNDATSISVPSGEAISGIELSLDESVLPVSAAKIGPVYTADTCPVSAGDVFPAGRAEACKFSKTTTLKSQIADPAPNLQIIENAP